MIGIYKITSPTGRIYIGQSIDIINRFNEYRRLKCKGQIRLYNSFNKHGIENHKFEAIEECEVEKLNERERYWQEYYDVISKKGLNCMLTRTNDRSGKICQEVINKRSMTKYGRLPLPKKNRVRFNMIKENNPFYGRKHTDETKKKISLANKGVNSAMYGKKGVLSHNYGKKHSIETIKKRNETKIKNGYKYPKHSKEYIMKISLAKKGKYIRGLNPNSKIVLDLDTGIYYDCLKDLSCELDINYGTLRSRLKKSKYRYQYV